MTSILLDTNVVLDVLLAREEWCEASEAVWSLVENGKAKGYLAAHAFTTIAYLVRRHGSRDSGPILRGLLKIFHVAPVDDRLIRRAVSLDWPDFEDAVVSEAAVASGCKFIVTRNVRDFAHSPLPAITPEVARARLVAN